MPGIRTSGAPEPLSTICMIFSFDFLVCSFEFSVSERLARLQSVLNPREGLGLAAQLEKRLALEIQDVLLADRRLLRQRAAGQDERQRAADERVVVADSAGAPREVDAELERGEHALAANADGCADGWRTIAFAHALERDGLRIGHESIAIHGDAVDVAKEPETSCVRGAGRGFSEADGLERVLRQI